MPVPPVDRFHGYGHCRNQVFAFCVVQVAESNDILNCSLFSSDGSLIVTKVSQPTRSRANILKLAATTASILSEHIRSAQVERDLTTTVEPQKILKGKITLFCRVNVTIVSRIYFFPFSHLSMMLKNKVLVNFDFIA